MKRDAWLQTHPYLEPVARLCAEVETAAAGLRPPALAVPSWPEYAAEFAAGVPLLRSEYAAPDLEPVGALLAELIEALASGTRAGAFAADARALAEQVRAPGVPQRAVDWLLGDESFVPASPGLLRYLGWTAASRTLRPVLAAFAAWREEDRWLRGYCPACGTQPAMSQLVGVDPGRRRLLACGCCGSRWRFKRTGCPFCDSDTHRLGVVGVEGEAGLRIDFCETCRGYLKTYVGEGDEGVLLADWTSLHLDVIAHDRGLERLASSLFDLGPLLGAPS